MFASGIPSLHRRHGWPARRLAAILLILLLLPVIGGARAASRDAPLPAMLAAVNAARAGAGLPALYWDTRLAAAAAAHAADLQTCMQLSHSGCDGSDLALRLRRADYPYRFGAENLALCACDAAEAVRLWLGSEGHRRNLLAPAADALGAARLTDTGDPRRVLWVLVLGKPAME
jgi:uncharacterized protein YkwD